MKNIISLLENFVVRHNFLLKICTTLTRVDTLRLAQLKISRKGDFLYSVRPVGVEPTTLSLKGICSTS
jgi:hypothetical protein